MVCSWLPVAASRGADKVVRVLVLCLLALFSFVLPSFLGSFPVERTEDTLQVTGLSIPECISVPERVVCRLSLLRLSHVLCCEPVTVLDQDCLACPPPEPAETGTSLAPHGVWEGGLAPGSAQRC